MEDSISPIKGTEQLISNKYVYYLEKHPILQKDFKTFSDILMFVWDDIFNITFVQFKNVYIQLTIKYKHSLDINPLKIIVTINDNITDNNQWSVIIYFAFKYFFQDKKTNNENEDQISMVTSESEKNIFDTALEFVPKFFKVAVTLEDFIIGSWTSKGITIAKTFFILSFHSHYQYLIIESLRIRFDNERRLAQDLKNKLKKSENNATNMLQYGIHLQTICKDLQLREIAVSLREKNLTTQDKIIMKK